MNAVVLYLLIVSGGGHMFSRYETAQFDTIAECQALGRQIVEQNFNIRQYLCQGPEEVQAEYFPEASASVIQE